MIISHSRRFTFIKTAKTAGTSLEIALAKFCGPEDIITPVSPEDEKVRKRSGYPGPQNYLTSPLEYDILSLAKLLVKGKLKKKYYNHIPAAEVKKKWNRTFGTAILNSVSCAILAKEQYPITTTRNRPTILNSL